MFRCWRLYSWMRLICTSKIACGFSISPCSRVIQSHKVRLFAVLDLSKAPANEGSSTYGSNYELLKIPPIQPSPMVSTISCDRRGLQEWTHSGAA